MGCSEVLFGIVFIFFNIFVIYCAIAMFRCQRDIAEALKKLEEIYSYEASDYEKFRVHKIFSLYPKIAKKHEHILKYKNYNGKKELSHDSTLHFFEAVNSSLKNNTRKSIKHKRMKKICITPVYSS